ncbi:MAG: hypothetical protein ACQETF_05630 [Bacteroidota bacterium]
MKKLIKFFVTAIAMFLMLSGCGERGPVGPEGPRGLQGPAGPEVIPTSFEFEADLLQSNGFEFFQDIPAGIEVFESDVVLAYVLEDYLPDEDLEVWRQLPLTDFNSNGTVLINFDYTFVDVRIFMDANYNLGAADEYSGLLIRAVHVPAGFLNNQKTIQLNDAKTFSELETMLGVEVESVTKK